MGFYFENSNFLNFVNYKLFTDELSGFSYIDYRQYKSDYFNSYFILGDQINGIFLFDLKTNE